MPPIYSTLSVELRKGIAEIICWVELEARMPRLRNEYLESEFSCDATVWSSVDAPTPKVKESPIMIARCSWRHQLALSMNLSPDEVLAVESRKPFGSVLTTLE